MVSPLTPLKWRAPANDHAKPAVVADGLASRFRHQNRAGPGGAGHSTGQIHRTAEPVTGPAHRHPGRHTRPDAREVVVALRRVDQTSITVSSSSTGSGLTSMTSSPIVLMNRTGRHRDIVREVGETVAESFQLFRRYHFAEAA